MPFAVTFSGFKRLLHTVAAVTPAERLKLLLVLAHTLKQLPGPHMKRAAQALLATEDGRETSKRAALICEMASSLERIYGIPSLSRHETLRLEKFLWDEAQDLSPRERGRVLGCLLQQGADNLLKPADLSAWLDALYESPPLGRSSLLSGLAGSCQAIRGYRAFFRSDESGTKVWKDLLELALKLPPGLSEAPLEALANAAQAITRWDPGLWDLLLRVAARRPEADRAAIYGGMTSILAPDPDAPKRCHFDLLLDRMMALPSKYWPRMFDKMAYALAAQRSQSHRAKDLVDVCLEQLPPDTRIEPILRYFRAGKEWHDYDNYLVGHVLNRLDGLGALEQAKILHECGRHITTHDTLSLALKRTASLSPELRHWFAAGLLRNRMMLTSASGRQAIDAAIMPILEQTPPEDRAASLLHLLLFTIDVDDEEEDATVMNLELSERTWRSVNEYIDALSIPSQASLLYQFITQLSYAETPAWNWALARATALPRAYQPKLIHALASVSEMKERVKASTVQTLTKSIMALPAGYRALPVHAIDKAVGGINGWFSVSGYLSAIYNLCRLRFSLPPEDGL